MVKPNGQAGSGRSKGAGGAKRQKPQDPETSPYGKQQPTPRAPGGRAPPAIPAARRPLAADLDETAPPDQPDPNWTADQLARFNAAVAARSRGELGGLSDEEDDEDPEESEEDSEEDEAAGLQQGAAPALRQNQPMPMGPPRPPVTMGQPLPMQPPRTSLSQLDIVSVLQPLMPAQQDKMMELVSAGSGWQRMGYEPARRM